MKIRIYHILLTLLLAGCNDFLEEKSQDRVRPSTVSDLEQLLLGEGYVSSHNLYNCTWYLTDDVQSNGVSFDQAQELHDTYKWLFTWNEQMFTDAGAGFDGAFYQAPYKGILGCNLILDNLDEMDGIDRLRENLRGEALTLRAWYYFHLVNLFGIAYNQGNPSSDLGVPLKLDSSVTGEYFTRNTVGEVYARIERDLLEGNRLLKAYDYNRGYFRMGHLAAKAILSRMYLYMEEWDKALAYADSVLMEKSALLDLNTVGWEGSLNAWKKVFSPTAPDEIIWARNMPASQGDVLLAIGPFTPSEDLLGTYRKATISDYYAQQVHDIRGIVSFAWDMDFLGTFMNFRQTVRKSDDMGEDHGIRTAELYLNRAEVYARKYLASGDASFRQAALADLNKLRKARFNSVYYEDIDITDGQELLDFCLEERRRELCAESNHRWCDLRRFGKTVTHVLQESNASTEYVKDMSRYVLPLQDEIMVWNPWLVQN